MIDDLLVYLYCQKHRLSLSEAYASEDEFKRVVQEVEKDGDLVDEFVEQRIQYLAGIK